MLEALRRFLNDPAPTHAQAGGVLRTVYALMFLAQGAVAMLLFIVMRLLAPSSAGASPLLSQILVLIALLELPLGVFLSLSAARPGGKGAALNATLLAGVILASPAWFLAFALLLGTNLFYLLALLLILVNTYALGFVLCGRFAKRALEPGPDKRTERLAEQRQG